MILKLLQSLSFSQLQVHNVMLISSLNHCLLDYTVTCFWKQEASLIFSQVFVSNPSGYFDVLILLSFSKALKPDQFSSVQFSRSVVSNSLWTKDCSTPGPPVHHQLLEFTQTHVHWVSDAIQPFHPLLFPSLPAFNLSQHQDLSKWVSSSHQVAKVLEFQLQHQSFQWTLRTDLSRMDWMDFCAVQVTWV